MLSLGAGGFASSFHRTPRRRGGRSGEAEKLSSYFPDFSGRLLTIGELFFLPLRATMIRFPSIFNCESSRDAVEGSGASYRPVRRAKRRDG